MFSIFLTGSSGFVGNNFLNHFNKKYTIFKYRRDNKIDIKQDIVIHFAGKAHDTSNHSHMSKFYESNTNLTVNLFDSFLLSKAKVFIMLSSVKAVADKIETKLTEDFICNPKTHYGKSKLLAEQYILSKNIPNEKRIYILRPCMIHGPGNKGNLNLLFKLISLGIPWPLGSFDNKRSFCSLGNLIFIIEELIKNKTVPQGIYNIADDDYLSTNRIIKMMCEVINKKPLIFKIPKVIIKAIARIGDILPFPINSDKLAKLTESYLVCNKKIKKAISKPLPFNSEQGMKLTLQYFKVQQNDKRNVN
tara:strand:+ start:10352 stop:11263 length:912 start_codon:yes stop_codon:yes gene_type:complete